MTAAVLEVRGVTKAYPTEHASDSLALSAVDLAVAPGEFVSVIGPSGCGKTTLLKICAGLLGPSSGQVLYHGNPGTPPPAEMGVVFQSASLLPWRTVLDNVTFPGQIQKRDKATTRDRALELLTMLGLADAVSKYPWELSGGMQQRVAIARSLLLKPAIIFMDEPFGALDAMTRERLNDEVQDIHLRTGATIMFVTHNIAEAVYLSDRVVAMSAGPGRISEIVEIDLPRPRTPQSYSTAEFRDLERRVREVFDTAAQYAGAAR